MRSLIQIYAIDERNGEKNTDRNTEKPFFLEFSVSDLDEKADLRIECAINYDFVNTIRF